MWFQNLGLLWQDAAAATTAAAAAVAAVAAADGDFAVFNVVAFAYDAAVATAAAQFSKKNPKT